MMNIGILRLDRYDGFKYLYGIVFGFVYVSVHSRIIIVMLIKPSREEGCCFALWLQDDRYKESLETDLSGAACTLMWYWPRVSSSEGERNGTENQVGQRGGSKPSG